MRVVVILYSWLMGGEMRGEFMAESIPTYSIICFRRVLRLSAAMSINGALKVHEVSPFR
jgi:hypothetical protein